MYTCLNIFIYWFTYMGSLILTIILKDQIFSTDDTTSFFRWATKRLKFNKNWNKDLKVLKYEISIFQHFFFLSPFSKIIFYYHLRIFHFLNNLVKVSFEIEQKLLIKDLFFHKWLQMAISIQISEKLFYFRNLIKWWFFF